MKEFLETIKTRNFLYLWASQIIAQMVINTLSFLILARVFDLTGSTIAVSFVWVAYALPAIVFGPIGAVAADVVDKRKLLIFCCVLQAMTIILFSMFYRKYLFLSYAVVFIYSLFNQFYVPAEAATLPNIVKKSRLPQANSLFFITVQSGLAVGFVFAGILSEIWGFGSTMIMAAVFLSLAAVSVSALPAMKPKEKLPHDIEHGVAKFFDEIVEGYSFIKNNKTILVPFILLIGLQAALSVIVVTLPVVATEIVKTKVSTSGLLIVGPGAAGALFGTFLISKLLINKIRKRRIIEYSIFIIALALLVLSSLVPHLSFWAGRPIAILAFFAAGAAYVGGLVPSLTYLQEVTPKVLLGRVFGNIWFITTVATVLPVLFSATITEIFGIQLLLSLFGIGGMVVVFASRFYLHGIFIHRDGLHKWWEKVK